MSKVRLACAVSRTVGGGTPERDNPEFWNGGISWASVKDFKDGSYKLATTKEEISEKGLKLSASHLIPAGTPIVCTRMAVGRIAQADQDVAINQDLRALYVNDQFDANYLIFAVDSIRPQIENLAIGSTVKGINIAHLLDFEIFSPPKTEQTKIAEILATVGRAIEQTDAVIAKQQRVRTGLMQNLLTCGMDERGRVRSEKTHKFKDSALGRIPEEWRIASIGDLFEQRRERGKPGLPVMSVVMKDGLVERASVERRVESNLSAEGHALVVKGDIAYNMMRMWQGVLGRALFDCLVSPAYVVLKPKEAINTHFAEWLFRDERSILKFRRASRGVVDDRLRLYADDLFAIEFAIPDSLDEQEVIAERIDAIKDRIAKESALLAKFRRIRVGLMQDLLYGRKRVTNLLPPEPKGEKVYAGQ
jgi:type I restriction enzyme, S subunit